MLWSVITMLTGLGLMTMGVMTAASSRQSDVGIVLTIAGAALFLSGVVFTTGMDIVRAIRSAQHGRARRPVVVRCCRA